MKRKSCTQTEYGHDQICIYNQLFFCHFSLPYHHSFLPSFHCLIMCNYELMLSRLLSHLVLLWPLFRSIFFFFWLASVSSIAQAAQRNWCSLSPPSFPSWVAPCFLHDAQTEDVTERFFSPLYLNQKPPNLCSIFFNFFYKLKRVYFLQLAHKRC